MEIQEKSPRQDSRCPDGDSNRAPPECKSGVLAATATCPVMLLLLPSCVHTLANFTGIDHLLLVTLVSN
jgi:hypothetical protein